MRDGKSIMKRIARSLMRGRKGVCKGLVVSLAKQTGRLPYRTIAIRMLRCLVRTGDLHHSAGHEHGGSI